MTVGVHIIIQNDNDDTASLTGCFNNFVFFFSRQGKLGHGDTNRVYTPKVIEGLQGLVIKKVCCGSQFSLALTSTGLVSAIQSVQAILLYFAKKKKKKREWQKW